MDHDGMREYLNAPLGIGLLHHIDVHRQRADQEVLRLSRAKQYDPTEVRYRAGVAAGISIVMDVIRQLRKKPDGS